MALALLGPASGCDGEWSFSLPTWDAGAPGTQDQGACSSWAARWCNYESRCAPAVYQQWLDLDQCVTRETLACELRASDPAVDFDASAVAACTFPDDCTLAGSALCLPAGKLVTGSPCVLDDDCASAICAVGPEASCGTCVASVGCDPACSADAICLIGDDGGASCVVAPAIGQPCTPPTYLCASGAECQLGGPTGSDGVCVPLVGLGQPCSTGPGGSACYDPNVATFCDATMHCSPYQPSGYGGPCGQVDPDHAYECVGWGTCEPATTPVCIPPAADGALCDELQGLGCLPPARCVGHVCLFPSALQCAQ